MNPIVAETVSCQNQITSFFGNQRIALLLRQSNIVKQGGFAPVAVMRMIFSLVFTGKNLFRYLQADASGSEIGKDTVYRFLNSVNVHWRKFLLLLCANVLNKSILPLTSIDTAKVFCCNEPGVRQKTRAPWELYFMPDVMNCDKSALSKPWPCY